MKVIRKSALLIAIILGICPILNVEAGVIKKNNGLVVDGQLNSTDWFDTEDSTYVEDDKLVIPEDSTGDTRIISKTLATEDTAYKNMLVMSGNIQFTSLPEQEKFVVAIGLDSVDAYSQEPGNIEIEFTNNGALHVGVVSYNKNGEAKVLKSSQKVGGKVGSTVSFSVTATTDKKLSVLINSKTICNVSDLEGLEGRVGFLQTGNCGVKVSQCHADFTQYDRPENTNITEDFETEVCNDNLFTSNFITNVRLPAYMAVTELDGNQVLMFKNTKLCYFGTKYQYSNFELTFDVPYYLRTSVKDENNKTIAAPTQEFLVSFGDDAQDFTGFGYATSTEAIRITKNTAHSLNHSPEKFRVRYDELGYVNPEINDGFSVLVRMVDGHLTVGMKTLKGSKFDVIAEADYEDFRTGYIKIWSVNDANFAIDNFKITNLDEDAKLTNVEFKGARIVQEDFDYQPAEIVFRTNTDDVQKEDVSNYMIIGMTVLGCALIVGCSFLIAACFKKKKCIVKEVAGNEIQ